MNGKIAIEPSLTNVKSYLDQKGYTVDSIHFGDASKNLHDYDAIVVTGQNSNFLGYEDTQTKAVIINADGLTPEQVASALNQK